MITSAHCHLMAQYNQWMNSRLYETCATLTEPQLREERGAFFGSIYLTLNHIAYADLAFLSRFTGVPADVPPFRSDLYGSFAALRSEREAIDARMLTWSRDLDAGWLPGNLTYTSKIDGKTRTVARWTLVTHMFNHQTHHRGQVTTLLSQLGLDMGSTDIPFMPQYESDAST